MPSCRAVSSVLLAALAPLGAGCSIEGTPAPTQRIAPTAELQGRVVRVADGDTVRVAVGGGRTELVRYIGVDTPETHRPNTPVECFGRAAAARNRALVKDERVRLVLDAEPRDRFGRLLAYVYRVRDGLFVNAALIRDGFASILTIPPNVAHAREFLSLERAARTARRGLWRACAP